MLTIEDESGRPRHVDMVILLSPFDIKCAAIHDNTAPATSLASDTGGYSSGAGTCATGLGNPAASFPYSRPDTAIGLDTSELDVTALWEGGVVFQDPTCLTNLVDIIGKDDIVGIAHGYECSFADATCRQKLLRVL